MNLPIIKAEEPPKVHYKGKWKSQVEKMKDKQSIIVRSYSEVTAFQNAIIRLGFSTTRRKHPKGFRVWFFKKPYEPKEKNDSRGNWNVDTSNLPIPESAFPRSERRSVSSLTRR